jgi:hypothetical protein
VPRLSRCGDFSRRAYDTLARDSDHTMLNAQVNGVEHVDFGSLMTHGVTIGGGPGVAMQSPPQGCPGVLTSVGVPANKSAARSVSSTMKANLHERPVGQVEVLVALITHGVV